MSKYSTDLIHGYKATYNPGENITIVVEQGNYISDIAHRKGSTEDEEKKTGNYQEKNIKNNRNLSALAFEKSPNLQIYIIDYIRSKIQISS